MGAGRRRLETRPTEPETLRTVTEVCQACGKRIVLVNVDKMRGKIGLTMGWLHVSRRANRSHRAIPAEILR